MPWVIRALLVFATLMGTANAAVIRFDVLGTVTSVSPQTDVTGAVQPSHFDRLYVGQAILASVSYDTNNFGSMGFGLDGYLGILNITTDTWSGIANIVAQVGPSRTRFVAPGNRLQPYGSSYNLILNFDPLHLDQLLNGSLFVTYQGYPTFTPARLEATMTEFVPLPAAAWLFASALGGLRLLRSRRTRPR